MKLPKVPNNSRLWEPLCICLICNSAISKFLLQFLGILLSMFNMSWIWQQKLLTGRVSTPQSVAFCACMLCITRKFIPLPSSLFLFQYCTGDVTCFHDDCYPLAFGVPAFLMIMAIVLFWLGRHKYKRVPQTGNIVWQVLKAIAYALKRKITTKVRRIGKSTFPSTPSPPIQTMWKWNVGGKGRDFLK